MRTFAAVLIFIIPIAAAAACRSTPEDPVRRGDVGEVPDAPVSADLRYPSEAPRDLLAPGDVLEIRVHGHPDLDMTQVRITASGTIQAPYAGEVPAAGSTVAEVQSSLRKIYEKEYLTRAELSITVTEYSPRKVYILGAVEREGAYEIPTGKPMDLLQLISLAGGFGEDADRDSIVIKRRSREKAFYRVSYGHLLGGGEGTSPTVLLHPDDTVIVGQQERVYVFGRVNRAGGYPLEEGGLTVIQAIALAGGFERIASEEGTVVIRKMPGGERRTYPVPVQSIVEDPERMDFPLQAGDIVYVPESLF